MIHLYSFSVLLLRLFCFFVFLVNSLIKFTYLAMPTFVAVTVCVCVCSRARENKVRYV